jgi:hypothetical protein
MKMWYWREDYFRTLKDVGGEAAKSPEWADYATFCSEYESGLRTQAFTTLERFMLALERAPFAERRKFVSWIMHATDGTSGVHMAVPHPLRWRIVEPTLLEWTAVEPQSSEPHRWLGGYDHLKLAVALNPSDELATRKLITVISGNIGTDHLPDYYVGDPHQDLAALNEADALLEGIGNNHDRQNLRQMIEEERLLITQYLSKRSDAGR